MLKILLVGRKLNIVDETREKAKAHGAELYGATDLDESRQVYAQHDIDAVIMGAGVELEQRLAIVRAAFEASEKVEVHMKDSASGPDGFLPFVDDLLTILAKSRGSKCL